MDNGFEQNYCSRPPKSIYGLRYDSIRLMKCTACFDKQYEKENYFGLRAYVLSCRTEIS